MRRAYDAATVRQAEAPLLASLPDGTLMQRAAFALARRCADLLGGVYGSHVVVLAGSGGNGGDALFAAAHLAARGARVEAILCTDSVLEPALAALLAQGGRQRVAGSEGDAVLLASADLVLDGLVGIGATGALREPMAHLTHALDALPGDVRPTVVAVDVPSGVDASTGEVMGEAVRADVTVTFGALKAGLLIEPGAGYAGRIELVDIGLSLPDADVTALDAADVARLVPLPDTDSNKYSRGVLGLVAGSDTYTGAAQLSVGGALGTGLGMARFVGVAHPAELVRQRWPEAVVTVVDPGDAKSVLAAGRVQAWTMGPGLGTDDDAGRVIEAVLGTDLPVLVDADGITWLAAHPETIKGRAAPTLLTPHAGELSRLMGIERPEIERRALHHVRQVASNLGVTVLLKGATTLVATPEGAVRVNTAQTSYLATAGSGDVLSGICGALLASGLTPLDAGSVGAFLHGLAGLLAAGQPPAPVTAMQVAAALPDALRAVRD